MFYSVVCCIAYITFLFSVNCQEIFIIPLTEHDFRLVQTVSLGIEILQDLRDILLVLEYTLIKIRLKQLLIL